MTEIEALLDIGRQLVWIRVTLACICGILVGTVLRRGL